MLELLVVLLVGFVVLGVGLLALLWIPIMLIGVLFKLVIGLVLLPFRIVGFVFALGAGLVGLIGKVFFIGASLVLGIGALLLGLLVFPVIPLVLLALAIWAVVRLVGPRPVVHTVG